MRKLWVLLILAGCHDAGSDALAAARSQYAALTKAGTPVRSRDYDAVLKTLASIPDGSRAKGGALALEKTIEKARADAPPLGVGASPVTLEETRAECERLAASKDKQELLDACRRRLEALEATP
jgi:hypothetical protein